MLPLRNGRPIEKLKRPFTTAQLADMRAHRYLRAVVNEDSSMEIGLYTFADVSLDSGPRAITCGS